MLKSHQGRALKKTPRRRPYSCDACTKQFETPSKLARHYLTHTGQKPFQCQDCPKTFRQLVHLERHMITHVLPFQCDVCYRQFKNADTFSKHQRLHVEGLRLKMRVPKKPAGTRRNRCPPLPLYCFGCQRAFDSEENRLLHQCGFVNVPARRKLETRKCDFCNKAFSSRSKLERHIMIHTGQKPFACGLCGKAFRQKAHLKIHELTHTQEKPFQCTQCFKSFKTTEQLHKHEEAHVAETIVHIDVGISATEPVQVKKEPDEVLLYVVPFQCSTCDRHFDRQETLDCHVCEEINTHMEVTCPRTIRKSDIYSDSHKVICPTDSELSERPLKTEYMNEMEHGNADALKYHQLTIPRNSLQLHPQLKSKTQRKQIRQPNLFRNQHLIFNDKRMANRVEGPLHNSGLVMDTFNNFLQRARGILLPRRKVRRCDRCDKTFPSMSKLRRHYLIHTGQKPFSCGVCGRNFRQSAHLKRHQVTHLEKTHLYRPHSALGDYDLAFDQWHENPSYQLHQNSCRPIDNSQDFSQMTYIVPEIKVELEEPDMPEVIKKPVVVKRERITLPRVCHSKPSHEKLQKKRTRAAQKRYLCSVCSKNFLSPSKLERHHLTHSGQRPFVCQECGKSFRQDPHLKRHMVTHVRVAE